MHALITHMNPINTSGSSYISPTLILIGISVPLIRAKFRAEHLALEHLMVILLAAGKGKTVLQEMMHQFGDARNGQRRMLLENMTEVPDFPEHNQL